MKWTTSLKDTICQHVHKKTQMIWILIYLLKVLGQKWITTSITCCYVTSVMSDSVRPQRWQLTRLSRPWDSPGKNTGVGCHFLLQCMKVKSESEVTHSCLTLSNPMGCSLPGSSVHGIFQARVLEWVAIAFSELEVDLIVKTQNCKTLQKITQETI